MVYWAVASLTDGIDRLVDLGARVHRGPVVTSLGAKVAMLVDPFGCAIGLHEVASLDVGDDP